MFRSTLMVLLINLVGLGFNLLVSVFLARLLGVDGFGTYSTLFTVATLVSILLATGLPTLLLREAAFALHDGNEGRILSLVVYGLVSVAVTTLVFGVFLLPALRHWYPDIPVTFGLSLAVLMLAVGFALSEVIAGFLQGLHKVNLGRLIAVLRPMFMVLFLMIPYAFSRRTGASPDFGYPQGIWLHTVAAGLSAVILGYFLLRSLPAGTFHARPDPEWRTWMRSSVPILLGRLALTLHQTLPVLMLAALATTYETGLFRVAERTAFFATFGLTAVGMVARPRLAQLYRAGRPRDLRRVLNRAAWAILLTTIPIVVLLILFRRPLLTFLFGAEYRDAARALVVIAIAQALNAATGLTAATLNMLKKEWVSAIAQWMAIALAFGLGLLLIPTQASYGAALASSAGLVAANILMLGYLCIGLRLSTTVIPLPFAEPSGGAT